MRLNTKQFKDVCNSILAAIDNSELSNYSEALELKTDKNILYLNVTNREYFASAKFELEEETILHVVINAHTFLKLISAITTEEIELVEKENYLLVKANGNYKFPMIYENGELLKLPRIEIKNETLDMNIGGDLLNSIINYNGKILNSKQDTTPIQKLYYLDQEGCVTFTSCACINNFKLEKNVKLLINNKVVKLFKLFKNSLIHFHLGYDQLNEYLTQTKIKLETPNLVLTAILPSDSLLSQYPVAQLRALANKSYPYNVVLEVEKFLDAINRLKLLDKNNDDCTIHCDVDEVTIKVGDNEEILPTFNGSKINEGEEYSMILRISHLKSVLENCEEQYITFNFGANNSTTLVRGNVISVIPECEVSK